MGTPAFAAFLTLLSVVTMGGAARKHPGEYWVAVMEEEPMPEAIRGLVRVLDSRPNEEDLPHGHPHSHHSHRMTKDCETETSSDQEKKKPYGDDGVDADNKEKKFSDDFEPRRNLLEYRS